MKLDFLSLDKLIESKANMRAGRKAPDVADILPSVRARGILVPILVRPALTEGVFEVVAGRRRHHCAILVADEHRAAGDPVDPTPCAIIAPGDEAAAIEASLIENIARLDPDEVSRWETFTALVRKGRSIDDLSTTFGLPELMIRRTLALGNLLPRIRTLYRDGAIDATTVRHLTLASKQRQRDWLALIDDPEAHAPTGHRIKPWLFGGASIETGHALFDLATYTGPIVTDLFGEAGYFADADSFWEAQNAAIESRRAAYLDAGWKEVVVIPATDPFHAWEYDKTPKRKGGRVYIDVHSSGEVTIHEGYLSRKEARRKGQTEAIGCPDKPARPEITSSMQTYLDLHRHAAVRAAMVGHPGVALRLMVAHAIAGSPLWTVRVEPQTARSDAIRESIEMAPAEALFDQRRRDVLALLGLDPEAGTVRQTTDDADTLLGMFLRLLTLDDSGVLRVLTIVMGETLAASSPAVDAVGLTLSVDMADWWEADEAFFELIRDREVLTAMLGDVGGKTVADANAREKTKTIKTVIADHLDGAHGRVKVERWVPRWMAFPPSAYTSRGGIGTVAANARVADAKAASEQNARAPDSDSIAPGTVPLLPAPVQLAA